MSRRAGFTFVELLVAATMLAVLMVGLGAHLRGGIAVWRRASALADTLQRRRVALEMLERDLRNALVYDERPDAYGDQPGLLPLPQFGAGTLAYFTVVPLSREAGPQVEYVTYQCGSVGQEAGLWRTSLSVAQARTPSAQPQPQRLLPDCETLSLEYAYRPEDPAALLVWQPLWSDPLQLPQLVRVSVRLTSGESLQRVVVAPGGVVPAVGGAGAS